MKSAKQIEQSIRKLHVEADTERRERTLNDLAEVHAQQKRKTRAFSLLSYGRTIIMTQKPKRIAAGIAVVLLLLGVLGLGTGSVAFSQARHAVSSTLSRLKSMITGDTTDASAEFPAAGEQTPNPSDRTIRCVVHFFPVPPDKQGIWQSLKDSGIEFIQASADPEVYFAVIGRGQAESFDASQTLECLASPSVLIREGQTATFAMTDDQKARGLGIGWLSTVSDDGTEIRSTISFHDGRDGFEIPNVAMEPGGAMLIRVKDTWSDHNDADNEKESRQEALIQVHVDLQQTP